MNKQVKTSAAAWALACAGLAVDAGAAIPGIGRVAGDASCAGTTCTFNLTARSGHITLGDGNQLLAWGFSTGAQMQYPGPTLIVNQGDTVVVNLSNTLRLPVSIVFPGQAGIAATGGTLGALTNEVATGGGTVSYTFTATQPGTYVYLSGSQPDVEVEMGLVGTLVVRPTGFDANTTAGRRAYGSATSAYDREYLFFQSEMDRCAHQAEDAIEQAIAAGRPLPDASLHSPPDVCTAIDPPGFKATVWFLNGRNGPDTMLKASVFWLPLQPYNALARMHPGERVLMRVVGGGREMHPFHHHGNNAWMIARDARVLESSPGAAATYPDFIGIDRAAENTTLPDRAVSNYTIQTVPGSTYDAIFTWTGKGLNWDPYGPCVGGIPGHVAGPGGLMPHEAPDSHCRAFPVTLPQQEATTIGGMWSGSPYLQTLEALPPLQGGLNPGGGFTFMWHSHTERELTNDDIFPGGMMTMMIVEGPGVAIDADGNID